MQREFTKEYMISHCGCYKFGKDISKLMSCSFMQTKGLISLESIIESEIPLKDKFWFVCNKLKTPEENQQIAIDVAEIVLPIYEKEYPERRAPREAIEAAKLYLKGEINWFELSDKRKSAFDAVLGCMVSYRVTVSVIYAMIGHVSGACDNACLVAKHTTYEQDLFFYLKDITKRSSENPTGKIDRFMHWMKKFLNKMQ